MSRRAWRLAGISLASALLALLLTRDYLHTPFGSATGNAFHFGFSAFVALVFLATGALVWYYARDRLVAAALWWFCLSMACTFAGQTGSIAGDDVLSELTTATSTATVLTFNLLVCVFPHRLLSNDSWQSPPPVDRGQGRKRTRYSTLLRAYLVIIAILGTGSFLCTIPYFLRTAPNPAWLNHLADGFFAVALVVPLVIMTLSYRHNSSPHERMQLRLYVFGGFAAVVPLLVVNIMLPELFGITLFGSELSTMTIVLLPALLGYSILRYQLLVFDTYVRRAVTWLVRITSLILLGSCVLTFSFLLRPSVAQIIFIVATCTVVGPFTWWLVRVLVERIFFPEQAHYRQLLDRPGGLARESFDVAKVAELIGSAAQRAFAVAEVGVLVFEKRTGRFEVAPPLSPRTDARRRLFSLFLEAHEASIEADHPIITALANTRRPLLLSDVWEPTGRAGGARILARSPSPERANPLLAPIRGADRRLIGVLVLGERGGERPYVGPDFGVIDLILTSFARILENALLYRQQDRLRALQATLYANMPHAAGKTVADVATTCVLLAADALQAAEVEGGQAEIWLGTQKGGALRRLLYAGTSASSACTLCGVETLGNEAENWSVHFYNGVRPERDTAAMPPCMQTEGKMPGFAFAWLPLTMGARLGVLLLTYPRPYFFSPEEKSLLATFSTQCAAALQSAQLTQEWIEAYERLQEAERLKEVGLQQATHELRTPLAAMVGFIELLFTYRISLSPAARQEYLHKAHLACEEVGLLVANFLDGNQEQRELSLHQVDLTRAATRVLELFAGIIAQEERPLSSAIPSGLVVWADDTPLRQVLLNLLGNALKYSPAPSPITVTGKREHGEVILRVRDWGPGIEERDQQRIFEPFVRLDRAIDSPTPGTGLGLSVCKRLVEAMGGRIWVESSGLPGQGSTFAFSLKVMQDAG